LLPALGFKIRQSGAGDLLERPVTEVLGQMLETDTVSLRGARLDGCQMFADKLLLGLGIGTPWLLTPGDSIKLA
jgi:hypothetical protein